MERSPQHGNTRQIAKMAIDVETSTFRETISEQRHPEILTLEAERHLTRLRRVAQTGNVETQRTHQEKVGVLAPERAERESLDIARLEI